MSRLRIAIVESPNPIDLFEQREESRALAESCKVMGHQTAAFFVRSRREFKETIKYLASAESVHAERYQSLPLVLHISCHGNSGCVAMGQDDIGWSDLVDDISPLFGIENYKGPLVLSLSSCDSAAHRLSRFIVDEHGAQNASKLPKYIFAIQGESVQWDDALMAWNLLYLKLSKVGLRESEPVRRALNEIMLGTTVSIRYSRWNDERSRYSRYDPDA